MTAETITGTIRHIFRFFVPPLLNLLFLSIVVGETLGVGPYLRDVVLNVRDLFSNYIHIASDVILNTTQSLLPSLKTEEIAKFNPQAIAQAIITDVSQATTYFGFISLVLFIFVAFIIDGVTLVTSKVLSWPDSRFFWFTDKFVYSRFSSRFPTAISTATRIQRYCTSFFSTPEEPNISERCAREVFGRSMQEPFSRDDLWRVVRAWLSKNATESFWLSEHSAANESTLNWQLGVDYARVYAALSILLYIYTLFKHPSILGILFPMFILLVFAGLRLGYFYSVWSLQEIDFKEFYYSKVGFGSPEAQTPGEADPAGLAW